MNEFLNPKLMTASVTLTHQSSGAPRLYPSSIADYCGGRSLSSCVGG